MHAHSAHLTTPSQPGRRLQWRSLALKSIAFGMALAATAPVQAKTFHCGAGDVPCLIAAITEANTNGQKKNRIQLDAGTYTLMAADNDTDGPNGFPSITSDLDITGARDEATGTIIERQARTSTFRLIHVAATGHLTLKRLTLRGGVSFLFPPRSGGGLFNRGGTVTITDSTLTNNVARFGGALYNDGGTVTLTHSILSGNIATTSFSGGGGLVNDRGTVTLTRSTLANNVSVSVAGGILNSGTVTITDSAIVSNRGNDPGPGGILNIGILTITNSTLSGNSGRNVGAILNTISQDTLPGTTTILNSTISGNFSTFGSGGILNLAGTVALQNTILALNSTGARFTGPDCNAVTSLDNNLIGTTLNCTIILQQSDLTGDPGLASFTDDGRPGNGHYPLLPTSRAINAGNDAVCPERDQLGRERHHPCDIGAVEFPDLGQAEQDDDDDGQDD